MDKIKSKKVLLYCLSFFIPFSIAFLVFYSNYISGFPFSGINSILTYDLQYEMIPLYSYLSHLGNGFNNLFFSTSAGVGGDFYSGFVLSVSPTDLIYSFIPSAYLPDAIFWSVVFKIGFCGLSFFAFTQKSRKINISNAFAIVFSSSYALMSYNFAFSSMPMWADLVILLPLLAIYTERLAEGERSLAFVLLTALTIIDNYYIAYMVIIALGLFFLFNLFEKKTEKKQVILNCFKFAYHIIFALSISMFVLLPVFFNLMGGKLSASSDEKSVSLIINSLGSVIRAMFSMNYSSLNLHQAPNIYCGSLAVVLVLLFFASKEKLRTRILALIVLVFYLASFVFGFLNNAWHGFSAPVGYCHRFSFTFCFFVLYFACRFLSLEYLLKSELYIKYQKLICIIFCFFTYVELFMNDSFIIANIHEVYAYQNYNEYLYNIYTQEITFSGIDKDEDLFRCSKNYANTIVDGMMYGYNDLAFFNSSFNNKVINFLAKMGIYTQYNTISDLGLTPPSASLLDVKYFVSYSDESLDYYDQTESYKEYYVFRNQTSFPIAFLCTGSVPDSYIDFTDDPYQNITLVYNDLFDMDDQLFCEQDYELLNDQNGFDFSFVPEKDGHYFFYKTDYVDLEAYDPNVISANNKLYYRVNGEHAGGYCWNNIRYCVDIGNLKAGEEVKVSLDTYPFDIGNIYLYYYNQDAMTDVYKTVSGFDVTYEGWHGLTLNGNVDSERELVITLPYLKGYNISVNGKKTEYNSYRDTFLVLNLEKGNNEIKINYIPYGFKTGIICSLIGFVLSIAILHRKEKKDHE